MDDRMMNGCLHPHVISFAKDLLDRWLDGSRLCGPQTVVCTQLSVVQRPRRHHGHVTVAITVVVMVVFVMVVFDATVISAIP
jgi:hypothetical protein